MGPRVPRADPPPANTRKQRARRWSMLAGIALGIPAAVLASYALLALFVIAAGVFGVSVSLMQALALLVWSSLAWLAVTVLVVTTVRSLRAK
jgi:hypothetical protein